jgi:hypothetical protein
MNYLAALILLVSPLTAFAATAGTDGYLREIGFTDAQLSTPFATEGREAFAGLEGTGRVDDPAGDVVDRTGVTSEINEPWGDILWAELKKNDTAQAWDLTVSFADNIPAAPTKQVQLFFLADADGDKTNNALEGYRIGTDAEFSVLYSEKEGWHTNFKWFNNEAAFWAVNKETTATFSIEKNLISMQIPFAELASTLAPNWRVLAAVADGPKSQIDVAPGVGFPPPKDQTYPVPAPNASFPNSPSTWVAITILAIAGGFATNRILAKRRQT